MGSNIGYTVFCESVVVSSINMEKELDKSNEMQYLKIFRVTSQITGVYSRTEVKYGLHLAAILTFL